MGAEFQSRQGLKAAPDPADCPHDDVDEEPRYWDGSQGNGQQQTDILTWLSLGLFLRSLARVLVIPWREDAVAVSTPVHIRKVP